MTEKLRKQKRSNVRLKSSHLIATDKKFFLAVGTKLSLRDSESGKKDKLFLLFGVIFSPQLAHAVVCICC